MGGPAATVIERPPAGRALAVRPLERPEAPAAAAMLLRTNDGLPVEELERDLRENQERWPSLQLGAFSPDGELWGVIAGLTSFNQRIEESVRFMEWGFSAWQSRPLLRQGQHIGEARVQGASVSINMGDILYSQDIFEALGPDLTLHFVALYADPRGLNLRNELAHGLMQRGRVTVLRDQIFIVPAPALDWLTAEKLPYKLIQAMNYDDVVQTLRDNLAHPV